MRGFEIKMLIFLLAIACFIAAWFADDNGVQPKYLFITRVTLTCLGTLFLFIIFSRPSLPRHRDRKRRRVARKEKN